MTNRKIASKRYARNQRKAAWGPVHETIKNKFNLIKLNKAVKLRIFKARFALTEVEIEVIE